MSAAARKDGPEGVVAFASRGDNVTIRISGYLFPDVEHARDANALTGTVSIRAGAFGGTYRAMFHTWDFLELRDRLAELERDLRGETRFETLEHLLEMVFRGDGRGDFTIAGKATDDPNYGNRLLFELAVDHVGLKGAIAQLDAVLRAFPSRGERYYTHATLRAH